MIRQNIHIQNAQMQSLNPNTHTHILLSHKLSVSFLVVDRLIFVPIQNQ